MSRAREWAVRCVYELKFHDVACAVTLTYDEAHVPPTLVKAHLSGFVKRLRARLAPAKFRFFASGEYGEANGRPHYHAILFGVPRDAPIQACWSFGYAKVDPVTDRYVSYIAGYAAKKIAGPDVFGERIDMTTGEVYEVCQPFLLMSRRPGIGARAGRAWPTMFRKKVRFGDVNVPVPRFLHEFWKAHANQDELDALGAEKVKEAKVRGLTYAEIEAGGHIQQRKHDVQTRRRKL